MAIHAPSDPAMAPRAIRAVPRDAEDAGADIFRGEATLLLSSPARSKKISLSSYGDAGVKPYARLRLCASA
jgi:hypothetical protein